MNTKELISWKFTTLLVVLLVFLNLIDYKTTQLLLSEGMGQELNPLMNALIMEDGSLWLILAFKAFWIGLLWWMFAILTKIKLHFTLFVTGLVCIYTAVVARSVYACGTFGLL